MIYEIQFPEIRVAVEPVIHFICQTDHIRQIQGIRQTKTSGIQKKTDCRILRSNTGYLRILFQKEGKYQRVLPVTERTRACQKSADQFFQPLLCLFLRHDLKFADHCLFPECSSGKIPFKQGMSRL